MVTRAPRSTMERAVAIPTPEFPPRMTACVSDSGTIASRLSFDAR